MSKKNGKKSAVPAQPAGKSKPAADPAKPSAKPLIRAIRVSQEVLDAAKVYKKEKGVSFYQLGLNAISEVLRRKGYLKATEPKA